MEGVENCSADEILEWNLFRLRPIILIFFQKTATFNDFTETYKLPASVINLQQHQFLRDCEDSNRVL